MGHHSLLPKAGVSIPVLLQINTMIFKQFQEHNDLGTEGTKEQEEGDL